MDTTNEDPYPYGFDARIEKFGVGKTRVIWYNVLMLPEELRRNLPFDTYPRLRVEGEIADVPIANAFIPTGDGRNYVIVAPNVLKDAGVSVGDIVTMRFCIADQDHVDVPSALSKALKVSRAVEEKWSSLTPGKQRMLAQHVMSARRPETQLRRVSEAIEALVEHGADLRKWRDSKRSR